MKSTTNHQSKKRQYKLKKVQANRKERNAPEEEDLDRSKQDIEIEYHKETKLIHQDKQTRLMPKKPHQQRARREEKAEPLKKDVENENKRSNLRIENPEKIKRERKAIGG